MPITNTDALARTIDHREIFHDEMLSLVRRIMSGEMSPVMMAAVLVGLRVKKETIGEITAAAQVMREFATKVEVADAGPPGRHRLLGAVEVGEGLVALDRAVEEDPAEPLVVAGVDQLGLADRRHHPFRGGGPHARVVPTPEQVVLQQHLLDPGQVVAFCKAGEYVHLAQSCSCSRCPAPSLRDDRTLTVRTP